MESATPYDITSIPFFPYSPGLIAWAVFVVLALALLAGFRFAILSARKRGPARSSFDLAFSELKKLARLARASQNKKEILARASLIVKRLLSAMGGRDISHCTAAELEEYAKQLDSGALQEVLTSVYQIENSKYQPDDRDLRATELVNELLEKLHAYRAELQEHAQ